MSKKFVGMEVKGEGVNSVNSARVGGWAAMGASGGGLTEKLEGAQFRWLNEAMYSAPGEETHGRFARDAGAFEVYHKGFRKQAAKWPQNPLHVFIAWVQRRAAEKKGGQEVAGGKKRKRGRGAGEETGGRLVVADFGCGEAELALRCGGVALVHSFDLVALNDRVTPCNVCERVPLEDSSVDAAVFCLSLMGTDYILSVAEACRVLRDGGTLKVAEVKSRFVDDREYYKFCEAMHHMGLRLDVLNDGHKMFVLFEFTKVGDVHAALAPLAHADKHVRRLAPPLKSCVYKKR